MNKINQGFASDGGTAVFVVVHTTIVQQTRWIFQVYGPLRSFVLCRSSGGMYEIIQMPDTSCIEQATLDHDYILSSRWPGDTCYAPAYQSGVRKFDPSLHRSFG